MVDLIEADKIFINTVSNLMTKWGIDYDTCTKEQVDYTIRLCTKEFNACWEELLNYIYLDEDDNKKMQTRAFIRQNMFYKK